MSTFTDYASKPTSRKIVLLELDLGFFQDFWVNYRAGMWYVEFDKAFTSIIVVDQTLITNITAITVTRIGSVSSDGVPLTEVTSTANLTTTAESFYFDPTNEHLFVHLENWDEPSMHVLVAGQVRGYTTQAGVWNDQLYEGRLKSAPSISQHKDPLFFGRLQFGGGTVTLINEDGALDELAEDNDVYGQEVRILVGFDDMAYANFEKVWTGYIEDLVVGQSDLRITMTDERKRFSRQIGTSTYDQSTYPNLDNRNVGRSIPLIYGTCVDVPVVCTNENGSEPFVFKFADTEFHSISTVSTVYVSTAGTDAKTSVTFSNVSKANGTFELSAGSYAAGDHVTIDVTGYDDSSPPDGSGAVIDNALDIIEDVLSNYLSYTADSSDIYDTTEWASATSAVWDVGIVISEPTDVSRVIEEISNTVYGQFLVKADGLFTFRKYDEDSATHAQVIPKEEVLNRAAVTYSPSEVLTSVQVGHTKEWAKGHYQYLLENTDESAIFSKFRVYRQKTFDSLTTNATDAQSLADDIMDQSGIVRRTFPIVTKYQSALRELGDWVFVELDRANSHMLGDIIKFAEVVGVNKDLNGNTISLECRLPRRQRLDGGDAQITDNDILDGGNAATSYTNTADGEDST